MPIVLNAIKPTYPDLHESVPEDWEFVGRTPKGLPIYRNPKAIGTRNVPLTDKDGRQVYGKHPTTGEELWSKRKLEWWYEERFFTPNNQGNGNISWEEYRFPTPEEIAAAERDERIRAMVPTMAATLVDEGLTAADFVDLVRALRTQPAPVAPPEPAEIPPPPPAPAAATVSTEPSTPAGEATTTEAPPADEPPPPEREFPEHIGFGAYRLSDGTELPRGTGKEKALEAELALTGENVPES